MAGSSRNSTPRSDDSGESSLRRSTRIKRAEEKEHAIRALMGRTLHKVQGDSGKPEHHYLVRWEGYDGDDDTWEPRSNLVGGAAEALRAFDSQEMPFTIVGVRQRGRNTEYLVRYGVATRALEVSPLCPVFWATEDDMVQFNSRDVVQAAIGIARKRRGLDDESEDEEPKGKRKGKRTSRNNQPELLAIVGYKSKPKAKYSAKSKGKAEYLVQWSERGETQEAWLDRAVLYRTFPDDASRFVAEYWESANKPPAPQEAPMNEYELQRLKNMQDNQMLLQQLGLSSA